MQDRECLVFVEVRYRRSGVFASAAASVDAHKQRKLALAAAYFLSRKPRYVNAAVRFDVLAIDSVQGRTRTIDWIKDAFRPNS